MKPYLLSAISLALLFSGILFSYVSIISHQYKDVNYGYGDCAVPPSDWQYRYWSVLSHSLPHPVLYVNGVRENVSSIAPVKLSSPSFYVYSVEGYVQPFAYLSIYGIFAVFLGTLLGLKTLLYMAQYRAIGPLAESRSPSGSLSSYALKRIVNALVVIVITVTVILVLEVLHGNSIFTSMFNILTFNGGISQQFEVSVDSLLLTSLGYTSLLLSIAMPFSVFVGSAIAMRSITNPSTIFREWKYIGSSLASWVLGLSLIYAFHYGLQILPSGGIGSPLFTYLILPVMSLVIPTIGITANRMYDVVFKFRSTEIPRHSMKGLSEEILLYRHVFGRIGVVLLNSISSIFSEFLLSDFFTEVTFAIPGIGFLSWNAVVHGDYHVLEGIFLLYTVIIAISNLISDLVYGLFDPRVRVRK